MSALLAELLKLIRPNYWIELKAWLISLPLKEGRTLPVDYIDIYIGQWVL